MRDANEECKSDYFAKLFELIKNSLLGDHLVYIGVFRGNLAGATSIYYLFFKMKYW